MSVNQCVEAQGLWTGIQAAFSLHHLGHSHNMQVHRSLGDPSGAEVIYRSLKAAQENADSPG
jgi:enoyl-CoA hydratase